MKIKDLLKNYSMREKPIAYMERWMSRQVKGESLLEMYAPFWFWVGIVGGFLLGLAGAIADGSVVYGIFFDITESKSLSLFLAGFIAVLIQILIAIAVILSILNLINGKYKQQGYGKMLFATLLCVAVGLGSSLYLSNNSKQIVLSIAKPASQIDIGALKMELDDRLNKERIFYDQQIAASAQLHEDKIAALQQEAANSDANFRKRVEQYQAIKDQKSVIYLGKLQAASQKTYGQKLTDARTEKQQTIQALQAEQRSKLQDLKTAQIAAVHQSEDDNLVALQRWESNNDYWGMVLKFANFGINILRATIVAFLFIFVNDVRREQQKKTQPDTPNEDHDDSEDSPKTPQRSVSRPRPFSLLKSPAMASYEDKHLPMAKTANLPLSPKTAEDSPKACPDKGFSTEDSRPEDKPKTAPRSIGYQRTAPVSEAPKTAPKTATETSPKTAPEPTSSTIIIQNDVPVYRYCNEAGDIKYLDKDRVRGNRNQYRKRVLETRAKLKSDPQNEELKATLQRRLDRLDEWQSALEQLNAIYKKIA